MVNPRQSGRKREGTLEVRFQILDSGLTSLRNAIPIGKDVRVKIVASGSEALLESPILLSKLSLAKVPLTE